MSNQNCISCGMPIRLASEAAAGKSERPYCHYCSKPDGSMKDYDEVLEGMSEFLIRSQGIDKAVATKMAAETLASLPAWAER